MDGGASRTAQMVAAFRARASARPEPICDDPWAASLAGRVGESLADELAALYPPAELWIALRTAWLDEQVASLAGTGSARAQVVLLGAGLDARAARLARPGLRWFEVDHPATQREKQSRVEALAGYPSDAATFVPCDFEQDDPIDQLARAGFAAGAPALVIWEGVVPYLTEAAVRGTLTRIAAGCHGDSVVLFDALRRNMAEGGRVAADDDEVRAKIAGAGEPFRFGLNDPVPFLAACGFRHLRIRSFDELCLERTGTYERARKFRFQFVVAASAGASLRL